MPDSKQVEIAVIIAHTIYHDPAHREKKAILVNDGERIAWLPWSCVSDYCEEKGVITSIFISEYLAKQKGFI